MNTCGYCGSNLQDRYCSFCEMELTNRYILEDGKRLDTSIDFFPEKQDIFKNTKELLELETIELLCLLRHAREYRSEIYKLRILTHRAKEQGGDMKDIEASSYNDYEEATKKVRVIENIILDRVGYYPQKVTENLLAMYLDRIEQSQTKKMTMKKAVVKNGS